MIDKFDSFARVVSLENSDLQGGPLHFVDSSLDLDYIWEKEKSVIGMHTYSTIFFRNSRWDEKLTTVLKGKRFLYTVTEVKGQLRV